MDSIINSLRCTVAGYQWYAEETEQTHNTIRIDYADGRGGIDSREFADTNEQAWKALDFARKVDGQVFYNGHYVGVFMGHFYRQEAKSWLLPSCLRRRSCR